MAGDRVRPAWRPLSPLLALGAVTLAVMAAALVAASISGISIEEAVADQQEVTRHRFLGIVFYAAFFFGFARDSLGLAPGRTT